MEKKASCKNDLKNCLGALTEEKSVLKLVNLKVIS